MCKNFINNSEMNFETMFSFVKDYSCKYGHITSNRNLFLKLSRFLVREFKNIGVITT
jgi:hypothetical protein